MLNIMKIVTIFGKASFGNLNLWHKIAYHTNIWPHISSIGLSTSPLHINMATICPCYICKLYIHVHVCYNANRADLFAYISINTTLTTSLRNCLHFEH